MKVKVFSGLMLALLLMNILPLSFRIQQVEASETTIFEDDFEGYSIGTFPSAGGWELWTDGAGSEHQVIVNSYSNSPTKSLQLLGKNYWSAIAALPYNTTQPFLSYEVCVRINELATQYAIARVGFVDWYSYPTTVRFFSSVAFMFDGTIRLAGYGELQTFVPGEWYKVKQVTDRVDDTSSVWINGVLKASNVPVTDSGPPRPDIHFTDTTAFAVTSLYPGVEAYFDDVKLIESAPAITILSPQNTTYTSPSIPLTFTVNETASWMGYSLDGQANVTVAGNTTLTGLLEGAHNLVVYANNTEGSMWASRTIYFTVDTTPPTGYILSPENTTYTVASVPLTFTVNEPTSWIGYSLDDQANITISSNTTLVDLIEGTHSVIVYANDTFGNMGAFSEVSFTIALPPAIYILSPENTSYAVNDVPLTFTIDEPTDWISYSLDNQANVTITGNTTLTSLTESQHSVVVYANDTSGDMGSSEVYFTVDLTPPTVSIVSPENTTYTVASVPLTFTVNEPTSWIGYSLDDQANITISGNTALNIQTNGSHNIIVYAKDMAGNTAASNRVFFTSEIPYIPVYFGLAEYDYFVVAGHQMTPTLPPSAPQPDGFTFTLEAFAEGLSTGEVLTSLGTGGYDFGSISYHGGRTYLCEGSSECEPTGSNWNAYVVVNVTNNLGYTITIEDLTAEVTDGTPKGYGLPGDQWLFPISGENVANCSMIALDTFDPWDYNNLDEINYNTGVVEQIREEDYPDHFRAASGTVRPSSIGRGPGSLLLNDLNGDALTSGHVSPKNGGSAITLNAGETFTDYFGVNILGDVAVGTQINATITLRLYYSPPPEGEPALADVQMSNLQPLFYCGVYGPTTYIYPEWQNLKLNATVQNLGNVPVNLTINVYYSTDYGGTWIQIGSPQIVLNLSVATEHLFTFYWNVKAANLAPCWKFIKANATATNQYLTTTCEFTVRVRCLLTGNADGDGDVDVGDQRKTALAMFTSCPEEGYLRWNNAAAYGPQIFTDFDGDGDVDVGDQRKQQIRMFLVDPCEPRT